MKKLFFLLCLFIYLPVSGQARVGSSLDEIKTEFPEGTQNLSKEKLLSYQTQFEDLKIVYFFDDDKICIATAIYPHNSGAVNRLAESYNKKYTIISQTKWTAYFADGICDIVLTIPGNDKLPYFVWKSVPKD